MARVMRRRRILMRAVALVFLGLVCGDVAFDAGCDPILVLATNLSLVRAHATGGADACAPACRPDGFCCSRSLVAGPVATPPVLGPLVETAAPPPPLASEGVRPVPYRPPLFLA